MLKEKALLNDRISLLKTYIMMTTGVTEDDAENVVYHCEDVLKTTLEKYFRKNGEIDDCPFCRYKGELVVSEPYKRAESTLVDVYVVCKSCGASTQIQECDVRTDIESVSEYVIAKWNNRIY